MALAATVILALTGCVREIRGVQALEPTYPIPIVDRLEDPPAGEPESIREIVRHSEEQLRKRYCDANRNDPCCRMPGDPTPCADREFRPQQKALRDAHAKHHGCVLARFEAIDDSPADLAKGVFSHGVAYDAVVRFSNGNPVPQPDPKGDGRGMAIKLLEVPGAKILDSLTADAGRR